MTGRGAGAGRLERGDGLATRALRDRDGRQQDARRITKARLRSTPASTRSGAPRRLKRQRPPAFLTVALDPTCLCAAEVGHIAQVVACVSPSGSVERLNVTTQRLLRCFVGAVSPSLVAFPRVQERQGLGLGARRLVALVPAALASAAMSAANGRGAAALRLSRSGGCDVS